MVMMYAFFIYVLLYWILFISCRSCLFYKFILKQKFQFQFLFFTLKIMKKRIYPLSNIIKANKSHINYLSLIEVNPVSFWVHTCPTAVEFNSKIVFVHSNSEKSSFSPVSSPTVSHNPEFCSILFSPSNHWNLMIWYRGQIELLKNTSCISFKFFISVNTARNWSSCINFSLDLINAFNQTIFFYFPHRVSLLGPTISFIPWTFTSWWSAVHTFLDIWTWELIWIFGLVGLASFLWNTVLFGINPDSSWISAITWSSCFTIDHYLRW